MDDTQRDARLNEFWAAMDERTLSTSEFARLVRLAHVQGRLPGLLQATDSIYGRSQHGVRAFRLFLQVFRYRPNLFGLTRHRSAR